MWESINELLESMKYERMSSELYKEVISDEMVTEHINKHEIAARAAITKETEYEIHHEVEDSQLLIQVKFRDYNEAEVDRCIERYEKNLGITKKKEGVKEKYETTINKVFFEGAMKDLALKYLRKRSLDLKSFIDEAVNEVNNSIKDMQIWEVNVNSNLFKHTGEADNEYTMYEVSYDLIVYYETAPGFSKEEAEKVIGEKILRRCIMITSPNHNTGNLPYTIGRVMKQKATNVEKIEVSEHINGKVIMDIENVGIDERIQQALTAALIWEFLISIRFPKAKKIDHMPMIMNKSKTKVFFETDYYKEDVLETAINTIRQWVAEHLITPLMSKYYNEFKEADKRGIESLLLFSQVISKAMREYITENFEGVKGIEKLTTEKEKSFIIHHLLIRVTLGDATLTKRVVNENPHLEEFVNYSKNKSDIDLGGDVILKLGGEGKVSMTRLKKVRDAFVERGIECTIVKSSIHVNPYSYLRKFDDIQKELLNVKETNVIEVVSNPYMLHILEEYRKPNNI